MRNINERLLMIERTFQKAADENIRSPCALIRVESILDDLNMIYYFPQGIRSAATHICGGYDVVEVFIEGHKDVRIKADFTGCLEWNLVQIIENPEESEKRKINFARAIIEVEPQCALLLTPEYADVYEFLRKTPPYLYKNY